MLLVRYFGPGSKLGSLVNVIVMAAVTVWGVVSAICTGQVGAAVIAGPIGVVIFSVVAWLVWTDRKPDVWFMQ